MKLVNLGCGNHFHTDWINLDKNPLSRGVKRADVAGRLPFEDSSVDVVYSSHVVEHLESGDALAMLRESHRILKDRGVIRIVTPDLETIVRTYLVVLHDALEGKAHAAEKYDWLILEMFDQLVRERRGGAMADFLRNPDLTIQHFIRSRIGQEVEQYWSSAPVIPSPWARIRGLSPSEIIVQMKNLLVRALIHAVAGRNAARNFELGRFRRSGEIHYRLYDRFSLQRLLATAGFREFMCCRADESKIPNFSSYELDTVASQVRKPDSIHVEAIK